MKAITITEEQENYFKENWQSKTTKEWMKYFGFSRTVLDKIARRLGLDFMLRKKAMSEESKQKISEKRKIWLKNNPDKHPWRHQDKFKSIPCERVKGFLHELKVDFISEFCPEIDGRAFSIDIALPDKMIALEINGNQHYEKDGQLKPYYQKRHDLLVAAGWNVFEIHYSACFNLEKWSEFAHTLKSSTVVKEFDYFYYTPKPKGRKKYFCQCGGIKSRTSKLCRECRKKLPKLVRSTRTRNSNHCECGAKKSIISARCRRCNNTSSKVNQCKVIRPSKEELFELIWQLPTTTIAKDFNISDTAVKKWAKSYNIAFPPRGYWAKKKAGMINECNKIRESIIEELVSPGKIEFPSSR